MESKMRLVLTLFALALGISALCTSLPTPA